jgi:hypothetical protein
LSVPPAPPEPLPVLLELDEPGELELELDELLLDPQAATTSDAVTTNASTRIRRCLKVISFSLDVRQSV